MISVIEFVDTPCGREFFFKAQGFGDKIHSENYRFPEGLKKEQQSDFMIECRKDFEKELWHQIRFKANPNYERDNALSKATINKYQ